MQSVSQALDVDERRENRPLTCQGRIWTRSCYGSNLVLLKSKRNVSEWNPKMRGALRSAFSGRQWTQSRLHKAGLADHNKCMLCLGNAMVRDAPNLTRAQVSKTNPTEAQVSGAPVGNLPHRNWCCKTSHPARIKWASPKMTQDALNGTGHCDPIFEKGLLTWDGINFTKPKKQGTFYWRLRPKGGLLSGTIYTDGSRLDGPTDLIARCGWAFVVVDAVGVVIASARGVTPEWVTDIGGAEAWAILQALPFTIPGPANFRIDCQPCVAMLHSGVKKATSAKSKYARIFNLIFPLIDDLQ